MKLKWMGHSCFLLTAKDGRTLLTDPFDETVGYDVPGVPADVVTCSHGHFDHHATASLPNGYTIVDQPGIHHTHGFVIEGVASFHDDQGGILRGGNIIFVFEIDGLRIAHLGDLGHMLSQAQCQKLENLDVLLIPVGGTFTIDNQQAAETVRRLAPKIAIPMHYKTRYLTFNVSDEHDYAKAFRHVYLYKDEIELSRENISEYPPVVIMEYGARPGRV